MAVAFVLVRMVPYSQFGEGQPGNHAPVLYALRKAGLCAGFQSVVAIGALVGMASALLAFQFAQARLWFAMSRDRLLPTFLSRTNQSQVPIWATWTAGAFVGIFGGLMDIGDAADLANIGTLFAFVLVCLGVVILRKKDPARERMFKVPMVPLIPWLAIVLCAALTTGLTIMTWVFFLGWMMVGLASYFFYSRRRSQFAASQADSSAASGRL